jgi:hypothetical protein
MPDFGQNNSEILFVVTEINIIKELLYAFNVKTRKWFYDGIWRETPWNGGTKGAKGGLVATCVRFSNDDVLFTESG